MSNKAFYVLAAVVMFICILALCWVIALASSVWLAAFALVWMFLCAGVMLWAAWRGLETY